MKCPLLVCFLLSIAAGAHSEPYLVGTGGSSTPDQSHYSRESAFRIGLGYRFASALSAEASYVKLGTSSIDGSADAAQTAGELAAILGQQFPGIAVHVDSVTGELAVNGVAVALQAESRITRAFGVYGRIGAFGWACDQQHTLALRINDQPAQETSGSSTYRGVDLVVGVGANLRLSEHWGLTLEATNYAIEGIDSRYLGGGMKYYF